MPKITVVFPDYLIIKDNEALHFEGEEELTAFDAFVSEQGHTDKNAIQWDGETGEIEDNDPTNDHILPVWADVEPYSTFFDTWKENRRQTVKTNALAQDAEAWARRIRQMHLRDTDWMGNSDVVMSQEWADYRQALRDLPETSNWNPSVAWDDADWSASLTGVVWPTQPA